MLQHDFVRRSSSTKGLYGQEIKEKYIFDKNQIQKRVNMFSSTGQSQSNDTCTLCSSWGCCSTSGGRKDKAQKSLKKSRLRWGGGAQDTKSKRTSGVHMSQVVGNVIGPVLCVPHHVLHVPPDGSPWGWHGEHKESWNKKQTLHDETLSVSPTHLLLEVRRDPI